VTKVTIASLRLAKSPAAFTAQTG